MKRNKKTLSNDEGYLMLIDNINQTTRELKIAYNNLENVVDPDLIDYYIYHTKAIQMRYKYLLDSVKKIEDSYAKNPLT